MLHGEGGSTWVSSPTRGKDEAPEAPGNRDESSNPMCAPARSINNTGRAPRRATLFLLASQGSSFRYPCLTFRINPPLVTLRYFFLFLSLLFCFCSFIFLCRFEYFFVRINFRGLDYLRDSLPRQRPYRSRCTRFSLSIEGLERRGVSTAGGLSGKIGNSWRGRLLYCAT